MQKLDEKREAVAILGSTLVFGLGFHIYYIFFYLQQKITCTKVGSSTFLKWLKKIPKSWFCQIQFL